MPHHIVAKSSYNTQASGLIDVTAVHISKTTTTINTKQILNIVITA